jgi:hypothetical protein
MDFRLITMRPAQHRVDAVHADRGTEAVHRRILQQRIGHLALQPAMRAKPVSLAAMTWR